MDTVTSTAVQTLEALLPTILIGTASKVSPQVTAILTLLPVFVQAAESMKAAGTATPEQLAAMWATMCGSAKAADARWDASDAPMILAKQAA